MLTPILMAGGSGTRLWPLSRAHTPKQVHALLDKETLLQKTAARLARGYGKKQLWVTTTAELLRGVQKDLPMISPQHISVEPVKRENAAALGLVLVRIMKEDPDAVIVYVNTDNYVRDVPEFLRVLKVAESVVKTEPDCIALIGIRPTYPETGYGYIRMGKSVTGVSRGKDTVYAVRAFVEKPDAKTAQKYVQSGEYLWNPTLIVARAETLLSRYEKYLPEMHSGLMEIAASLGTKKEESVVKSVFSKIRPVAMEYAILEKEKNMVVIPAAFGWTDVGSWQLVHDILSKGKKVTVARGPHADIDSSANLLFSSSGKLIATIGVHDMVVVETEDAILVCPKNRSQEVKKLVEELKKRKLEKYI